MDQTNPERHCVVKTTQKQKVKAWDHAKSRVAAQGCALVWSQVMNQVSDPVWDQVWGQAWGQVRNQVEDQIRNQIKDHIRNHK
jgi:hypothetical protein